MNEKIFKSILEKAVLNEYADIDNTPDHKFSLKHRIAMKRIFARYERNVRKLCKSEIAEPTRTTTYRPIHSIRQKLLIAMLIIILMSFLVGWVAVYVSSNFHGTVYHDYTQITAKNYKDCPQTIEYKFALMNVPSGFEVEETDLSSIHYYTLYMNSSTQQTIEVRQWVKTKFEPNYNTEHYKLEEVNVSSGTALCIDFSDTAYKQTLMVWDNGDYIIEVLADLDKESTIDLLKMNKL